MTVANSLNIKEPGMNTKNCLVTLMLALSLAVSMAFAAKEKVSAFKGTVMKIDRGAKTAVVKAVDGTEHVVHFTKRTTVHGVEKSAKYADDAFHGLREGSSVVVHYTTKGTEETAEEVDHIGNEGIQTAEGAVVRIDRRGKAMTIRTASGAEETYKLADHASEDAARDLDQAAGKLGSVTVYYTEESGRKVAHFFERTL
jgi:ribosomal protein L19